ncbi:MAG: type II toxin-antitoxin system HicB family antitoxin [Bacteroidota bacterium]|jgi:predicted RNase H-like HicB family nuclease
MLTNYISAALKKAKYETLEGGTVYAEIPELQGIWAEGKTVEECRNELVEVIEGWLFLKLRDGDAIPVLDGIDLNARLPADAA